MRLFQQKTYSESKTQLRSRCQCKITHLRRGSLEYTAIYVTAMPFRYIPDQWLGIGYGFAENRKNPDLVGPMFRDRAYAIEIHNIIKSWNYNRPEDPENYIQMSFIIEPEDQYSIYLYPSTKRASSEKFFSETEGKQAVQKYGKRLMRLVISMTFCKMFPLESDSLFRRFNERNQDSQPFLLTTFVQDGTSHTPLIDSAVLKFEYKYKKREELLKGEHEYWHGRNVMKRRRGFGSFVKRLFKREAVD